jgi:hypothetical protein
LCDSGKTGIEGLGEQCVEFLRCSGLKACGIKSGGKPAGDRMNGVDKTGLVDIGLDGTWLVCCSYLITSPQKVHNQVHDLSYGTRLHLLR